MKKFWLLALFVLLEIALLPVAAHADEHAAYLNQGELKVHITTAFDTLFTRIVNDQNGYCPPTFGCKFGTVVKFIEADPWAVKAVQSDKSAWKGWAIGNAGSEVLGRALDLIPFFHRCQCVGTGLNYGGDLEGTNALREGAAAIGVFSLNKRL